MDDVLPPAAAVSADPLEAGREALSRHAWRQAFYLLSQADRVGQLSAADLDVVRLWLG